jgi:hypothetical protein
MSMLVAQISVGQTFELLDDEIEGMWQPVAIMALPEVTHVQGSVPNTFETPDDGVEVLMVTSADSEDDTVLVPLTARGGAVTVTVLGGTTSVTVKVLQCVLDEAAGGAT